VVEIPIVLAHGGGGNDFVPTVGGILDELGLVPDLDDGGGFVVRRVYTI
jgi:hypothetical protein